jgi:hypothetical protein
MKINKIVLKYLINYILGKKYYYYLKLLKKNYILLY